ncbi:MAG: CotH kinase family protein [Bacteroidetes bacterium]|nr:CotH kinase family protein [Bacteroidota bacterium]
MLERKKPDAKWRYILNDLDIALGNNGWAPASFDILGRIMGSYGDNNRHVHIFRSLLDNGRFKNYFINRYADLVNTIFSSEYMEQHILNTRNRIAAEMPRHFSKWEMICRIGIMKSSRLLCLMFTKDRLMLWSRLKPYLDCRL